MFLKNYKGEKKNSKPQKGNVETDLFKGNKKCD